MAVLAVSAGIVGGGMVTPVQAQSSIKAVVNSEPVTTNEVNQRARFLHLVSRDTPNAVLVQQATEELIDEKLKFQEAKRHKIEVPPAQVDAAFASIAGRTKLSPQQLTAALAQSGIEANTLKTRLKAQIAWQQLVVGRFRQSVTISDQDVVRALQKQAAKDPKAPQSDQTNEYTIQQVIFVVPASAGKAGVEARMKEAEQFRAKFAGCATIAEQARAFRETVVKNLGKRTEDEIPGAFQALLNDTPAGKTTKAVPTPNGAEVLAVCEKKEIHANLMARSKVEEDLREKEGQVMARQYIQELRRFAVIEYK